MNKNSLSPGLTHTLVRLSGGRAKEWASWSLQTQLVTVVTTMILAIIIGMTVFTMVRETQSVTADLESRASTTIRSIDAAIQDALYFVDVDRIETIVENFATVDGVLVVRIYDSNGRILIATDDPLLEVRLEPDAFGATLVQAAGTQQEWASDRLIAAERLTVGNQVLGAVRLELSTAELIQRQRLAILQGLIIAALAGAVAILVLILISRSLTAPIASLVTSSKTIAAGEFDTPVVVQGGSAEITELTNTVEQMRKSLQEIYADLEKRVADRTVELKEARDEALVAKRIADENSRLKSEFLATMSHELRTPLNAIEGFTGIMINRMAGVEYNDKVDRYLHRIQVNSRRLLGLINDFLDLSRIESGRLELTHSPMSPAAMAQKWQESLIGLADAKGLALEVQVDSALPETIYGDEEAISKIVINLVGNAIKFTETGSVTLDFQKRDENMVLEVTDTGVGIPPHAREFIFDEFRQVDQSSKRKYGGTGLGLAIVQKLAREMGGTVTLHSEVGVGSTFVVVLPLSTSEPVAQE